jgi:Flp pilus assembly protein TadG
MTADLSPTGISQARRGRPAKRQRGQSLVEFAISSIVLLLLMMGLLDLSRAFYYAVNLDGSAREGARHGAWFNTAARYNGYLDDTDIMTAVGQSLTGAGFTNADPPIHFVNPGGCLAGVGNSNNNAPYAASAFPAQTQRVNVYICYTAPPALGGGQSGSMAAHPGDNSWRLGDINVSLLMNFGLITPFIQNLFGNGINVAYNEHFTIQGKP